MPKITSQGPSYDPNGPFTGSPHDDRPEVVVPESTEPEVDDDTEVTHGEVDDDGDADDEVPTTRDAVLAWVDQASDRVERARRVGQALAAERERSNPRVTVLRELEDRQRELSQHDDRF